MSRSIKADLPMNGAASIPKCANTGSCQPSAIGCLSAPHCCAPSAAFVYTCAGRYNLQTVDESIEYCWNFLLFLENKNGFDIFLEKIKVSEVFSLLLNRLFQRALERSEGKYRISLKERPALHINWNGCARNSRCLYTYCVSFKYITYYT